MILEAALAAARAGDASLAAAIDAAPLPTYAADRDGRITHFNAACVPLAGRQPQAGVDRWCVSWKLRTIDGEPLPHEQCPMAVAIREQRPVRGAEAVAEHPDGNRVRFLPFPTPWFDEDGELRGAINVLVDVTRERRIDDLRAEAARCRRLVRNALDPRTTDALNAMADECDDEADRLGRPN